MRLSEKKALVCFSGGMDSTTLLYYVYSKLNYTDIYLIMFDYSQKHKKELKAAYNIYQYTNDKHFLIADHKTVRISYDVMTGSAITGGDVPSYAEDKQHTTVVPGRNMLFLAHAVAYGEQLIKRLGGTVDIFFGPNMDDFKSYPDCREEFVQSISNAGRIGYNIGGIYAPFVYFDKVRIVKIGKDLLVPFKLTWSCYKGEDTPCFACDACQERSNAMVQNGLNYYGQEVEPR